MGKQMTEQSWKPLFRAPASTVTRVLRSPAFLHARERSAATIADAAALRELADAVESLDYVDAPLSAVADRVSAAVRFLRATADHLDSVAGIAPKPQTRPSEPEPPAVLTAGDAARERLVAASLHYLVLRDDLVPDFRAGGYLDDVLAMTWVFGVAADEIAPYLTDDSRVAEADLIEHPADGTLPLETAVEAVREDRAGR